MTLAFLINLLHTFSALMVAHFLGDYVLQNNWMALNKDKDWHAMFAHVGVYTSVFAALNFIPGVNITLGAIALILISHAFIDPAKARWKWIGAFSDQFLHIAILADIALMGWITC